MEGSVAAGRAEDRGSWPPSRPCFPTTERRPCLGCLHFTVASSAISATTSCVRSSACPTPPPDELGYPDAIVSVVGQIAAYDAWRQRVTLVDAVPVPPGATSELVYDLYDEALRRLEDFAAEGAKPIDEPVIEPPERDDELPLSSGAPRPSCTPAAVEAAREYIYAGDIFQVVLAQRFELDLEAEPLDLYRSLRQVNPSPYMYLLQYPELAVVGSSPEPMVAGARRAGHLPPDRRDPPTGPYGRGRPPVGRRAVRAPQGAGRARDAGGPGPQRRRQGGRVRVPRRWTS